MRSTASVDVAYYGAFLLCPFSSRFLTAWIMGLSALTTRQEHARRLYTGLTNARTICTGLNPAVLINCWLSRMARLSGCCCNSFCRNVAVPWTNACAPSQCADAMWHGSPNWSCRFSGARSTSMSTNMSWPTSTATHFKKPYV